MNYALFVVVGVISFFAGYAWCWLAHSPLDEQKENEPWT
jgi:hypothetical protein